jgi:integrase
MAVKGISTRSEALEFDDFVRLIDGLRADGEYRWELFCILSCTLALRISDVLNLKWPDLSGKDHCLVKETKTGKVRRIPLEPSTQKRIAEIYALMAVPAGEQHIFRNRQQDKIYTPQYVNRRLKMFRERYGLPIKNFSSHTFRKTFGRRIYDLNGKTEHAIVLINRALQHQNIGTTLIYLGLIQDELDEVYKQVAV